MNSLTRLNLSLNVLGLGLSLYAAYAALLLTLQHLGGTPICPVLIGIPACLIVFINYALITAAWGLSFKQRTSYIPSLLFFVGFIPAFLLALVGTTGEIFGFASCPVTETGVPKCYLSFGILIILAIGWGLSIILKSKLQYR